MQRWTVTTLALLAIFLTGMAPLTCCCAATPVNTAAPSPARHCCDRTAPTAPPHHAPHPCHCHPVLQQAPHQPAVSPAPDAAAPAVLLLALPPVRGEILPARSFVPPWESQSVAAESPGSLLSRGCLLTI